MRARPININSWKALISLEFIFYHSGERTNFAVCKFSHLFKRACIYELAAATKILAPHMQITLRFLRAKFGLILGSGRSITKSDFFPSAPRVNLIISSALLFRPHTIRRERELIKQAAPVEISHSLRLVFFNQKGRASRGVRPRARSVNAFPLLFSCPAKLMCKGNSFSLSCNK